MTLFHVGRILRERIELAEHDADAELVDGRCTTRSNVVSPESSNGRCE